MMHDVKISRQDQSRGLALAGEFCTILCFIVLHSTLLLVGLGVSVMRNIFFFNEKRLLTGWVGMMTSFDDRMMFAFWMS